MKLSEITTFLSCKKYYQLKYIDKVVLQEQEVKKTNHAMLMEFLSTGDLSEDIPQQVINQVVKEFLDSNGIKLVNIREERSVEFGDEVVSFVCDSYTPTGTPVMFRISTQDDSDAIKSIDLSDKLMLSAISADKKQVNVIIIKKPSIRIKKSETEEEFRERYRSQFVDETGNISLYTKKFILTDEDLETYKQDMVSILDDMKNCKMFYKTRKSCGMHPPFCPYYSVCHKTEEN